MRFLLFMVEVICGVILVCKAAVHRFLPKKHDVGIGPLPLINNVFHKAALQKFGYDCETFAYNPFYITQEFDRIEDWSKCPRFLRRWKLLRFAMTYLFRYRCLYLYFNGHILGLSTRWLWRIEPWLLKVAGVKTVILGYGADVQDLRRSPNLLFRHGMNVDYPQFYRQYDRIAAMVDLWSRHGDHVTGGCEWVDYQTRWDTLMLAHFSIDPDHLGGQLAQQLQEYEAIRDDTCRPLRVVHACNHKAVKGTTALQRAVGNLQNEGLGIELVEFYREDHDKMLREIALADVVADQFIVGWYAMFTLEALSLGKPVLCYLREDLIDLYTYAELIEPGEIPIINTDIHSIEDRLRQLCLDRSQIKQIGSASLAFVRKHHSTESVGRVFDKINRSLGIEPKSEAD